MECSNVEKISEELKMNYVMNVVVLMMRIEEHRLNQCKYEEMNYYSADDKIAFASVYSNDTNILDPILKRIRVVWNINNGHGTATDN